MAQQGGLIRQTDLDAYESVWRDPIHGRYRGFDVYSMAPPSSGGILLTQMLNMLSAYPVGQLQPGSADLLHLMTEVERRAYADRTEHLGDSDFYPVPIQKLIDPRYAKARMESYDPNKASLSSAIRHGVWRESEQTTHYSVIDGDGMMVALTTTLNSSFGNKWVIPGTGILMNNEMDDFAASTTEANQYGLLGNTANAIAPGKRMLSSMTPTLVLKDNQPVLITGSPGGSTIITTVLQVILNVVDHGQSLVDAVAAPRVHHQWQPDVIDFEAGTLPAAVIEGLQSKGHILQARAAIGVANSILVTDGQFEGVADPRDAGAAAGF
jgi:gamma-glutamyltranspeptidase/glutathione hydrolase